MSSLGSIPALQALTPAVLDELAGRTRTAHFDAGAVLRPAGGVARHAVFLLSGTLVATHTSLGGVEAWPDRWVGPAIADKPATLAGGPSPTGLTALTAVAVRLLPRTGFLRLLDEQPTVRQHALAQMAREAVAVRSRLARAVTLPAAAQVAAWLSEQDRDPRFAWRGSQEQLARVLGLSRVTVNRALAHLSQAGAVALTARGIVVVDRERLAAVAEHPE
ncbi:Crp/Fnr family transcriptional regulator [Micromonospora sp. WMMC241]|uniref:Crp/Fnr family transcriptional regulator n=1 Tax=Micromonospora sp. WMMC241 TaxID=3015159 RepID=UPI0022B658EC|nr:Crp/Fnr family transcriptional regulator [Micromonospora sp. WMMC241]MCZ7436416.1 Crp/Fnr family transcriptional regulator [Micromonospora sp. WMMC241]